MPRAPLFSEDEVMATIAEMAREGGAPPSVQRLRERLGGGSNSTYARHLARYHEQQAQVRSRELPAEVRQAMETGARALADTMHRAWEGLARDYEDEAAARVDRYREQVTAMEAALAERDKRIEAMERERIALETEIRVLRQYASGGEEPGGKEQ